MTSMDSYSNELPCFLISVKHETRHETKPAAGLALDPCVASVSQLKR